MTLATLVALVESPYLGSNVGGLWGTAGFIKNHEAEITELARQGFLVKGRDLVVTEAGVAAIREIEPRFEVGQAVVVVNLRKVDLPPVFALRPIGRIVAVLPVTAQALAGVKVEFRLGARIKQDRRHRRQVALRIPAIHLRAATEAEAADA